MKNIIFFFVLILGFGSLLSCNDRMEGDEIQATAPLKIDSVKIAQSVMEVYSIQTIKTYSTYASQCEGFYGYDYRHTSPTERKVVAYKFKSTASCGEPVVRASAINFRPQETGTYKFRFWMGETAAGEPIWHEETIIVQ